MTWRRGESRALGPCRDVLLYREYALALIWPRSVPEYIPDGVVSAQLNECARREKLPWEIYDADSL
jgi:hypothetical protein